ncbi:MAG: hypothetical protein AAGN35_10705 [Bacteroidota bacterium]
MKHSIRFWVVLPLLVALGGGLPAQDCNWRALPGIQGQPTVLELLTGRFSVGQGRELVAARESAFPEKWLDYPLETLPLDSGETRGAIFQAAWADMSGWTFTEGGQGDFTFPSPDGAHMFAMAGYGLNEDTDCGLRFFRLAGSYLQTYGDGQTPIFPNFNGGFYNYLKDSLFWGAADTLDYDRALAATVEMVQLTRAQTPAFLELLGDLLVQHRNSFVGNYFGYLAYMKAGLASGEGFREEYERKAIFALEAPRTSEDRFDRYRYTQLRKALAEDSRDVKVVADVAEVDLAPPVRFFPDRYDGRLQGMLETSQAQLKKRAERKLKFAEEVDRGDVKSDGRFNSYALFLIAVILGSVVFFWIRLRRAARTR